MSSSDLETSVRLRAVLAHLMDIMVDCADDAQTCMLLAGAAKGVRESIDHLGQLRVGRAVFSDDASSTSQPANNRSIADMLRAAHEPFVFDAGTSLPKRKAPIAATPSSSADSDECIRITDDGGIYLDGDIGQPPKKLLRGHKFRSENDVKELLEKATKPSLDGICVIDGCQKHVHVRGFCSADYIAFLRASRGGKRAAQKK